MENTDPTLKVTDGDHKSQISPFGHVMRVMVARICVYGHNIETRWKRADLRSERNPPAHCRSHVYHHPMVGLPKWKKPA